MTTSEQLTALAERVCDAARRAGADHAEAYVSDQSGWTAQMHAGLVEQLRVTSSRGIGLRAFDAQRLGYAYTSDVSESGIGALVAAALDNARHNLPDEFHTLPEPGATPTPEIAGLASPHFASCTAEDKLTVLQRMAASALAYSPAVRQVVVTAYGDEDRRMALVNSNGLHAAYQTTFAYANLEVIAEQDGEVQAGQAFTFGRSARDLQPESTGCEAAERAVGLLGARKIRSQRVPVALDGLVASQLLGHIARLLTGEAVQKRRSIFRGRLGERVAAECVTVVDDRLLVDGPAASPVDEEGVPGRRLTLIEDGTLRTFVHSSYTARKDGLVSTGNAWRSSYRATPEVATSNVFIAPGTTSRQDILRQMRDGLLVTDIQGVHTISPVVARFSVGLSGFQVLGGEVAYPVRGVTLAGDFLDLLRNITTVGSDLRFMPSHLAVGAPTVLVSDGLTVAGE